VVPFLFNALASIFINHTDSTGDFTYQSLHTIVRSAGMIALILFIIHRSGEPPRVFGLVRLQKFKDPFAGLGILVLTNVGYRITWYFLFATLGRQAASRLGYHNSIFAAPSGQFALSLLAVSSIANGCAEELVCRAYLLSRFEQLLGSTVLAWLLSSLLFGSYHIYQGIGGFVAITTIGLIYGAIFCAIRRIWPIAIAHALQDFISILALK
jgi:membrane protease YdiL (CAAX protease family)